MKFRITTRTLSYYPNYHWSYSSNALHTLSRSSFCISRTYYAGCQLWLTTTIHTCECSFILLYLRISAHWARTILRIVSITSNASMKYWSNHSSSNDGYCIPGLCTTLWANVTLRYYNLPYMQCSVFNRNFDILSMCIDLFFSVCISTHSSIS